MWDELYNVSVFLTLYVIDEGNREDLWIVFGTSISAFRLQRVMNELIEVYGEPQAYVSIMDQK